eukprot:8180597-Pyramimonas_sp.AAC.1
MRACSWGDSLAVAANPPTWWFRPPRVRTCALPGSFCSSQRLVNSIHTGSPALRLSHACSPLAVSSPQPSPLCILLVLV